MAQPVYSLKDFARLLESGDYYPYYGVLLYAPQNGLDGRLHEYVRSHWTLLNGLTGRNALLFALEDLDREPPIELFQPDDVYEIARYLGTSVSDLPCLVLFADPCNRNETLVLQLADFLGRSDVDDEDLTDFFRGLEAVIDVCVSEGEQARLACLHQGIGRSWPEKSRWRDRAARTSSELTTSVAVGQTIVQAVSIALKVSGLF